ncbi:MAG: M48 family metalloprotease, partial [Sphingomonadaceae bacterium]|nr:M48 family metalloprotease [Sphingomonadaceae bacterium]
GILMAGQQVALGKYLAFSRGQEAGADESAKRFMHTAGVSGRGIISFFKKLQNLEFRYSVPQDTYATDHPLTGDRIAVLQEALAADPAWNKPTDPLLEARFQRVKAKLNGYILDAKDTFNRYPESDRSIAAHYARAYAWHKSAYPDKALAEADALLATAPHDPYFEELKGQILLESGRPAEALVLLRDAVQRTDYQPLIAALFGHALIATENPANYEEAKRILHSAIARDDQNPFAWYQLGVIYTQQGDAPRAALASAERYNLEGKARPALANAELAMRGLATGTPDWLRAQDIALVSKTQADDDKRHHRRQQ